MANRCTMTATGACASRHATIQEAVDACGPSDTLVIGPGDYVEDVAGEVKLAIWQDGATLHGLTPGGIAWHDLGTLIKHELRDPVIIAAPGGIGIKQSGGYNIYVLRGRVSGAGVGILCEGGSRHHVQSTRVEGCGVGIRYINVTGGFKIQVNHARLNAIGIEVLGGSAGQVFFNELHANDIGIRSVAAFHTDINSNRFFCEGVEGAAGYEVDVAEAINPISGKNVNAVMEFNNNEFEGYAGLPWRIKRCDGSWTDDLALSPESGIQYGSNEADGNPLPGYNVPIGPGCN